MNTQEENNMIIAEFMGINLKPVRGDYRSGNSVFNPTLFKSQLECLSFCDEINIGKEADFAFYPMPDTKDYSLLYHSSWDWLMPVVEKIESTVTIDKDYENTDQAWRVLIFNGDC